MGNSCQGKKEVSVMLIGLDMAGKTAILNQLRYNELLPTSPTVGFTFETVTYKQLNINIRDTGGQDKIRDLWRHYYEEVDGILFVFDSTDRQRIEEARNALHGAVRDENLQNAFVCVLANKRDLKDRCMDVNDIQTQLQLPLLSQKRQLILIETSAKTGAGMNNILGWISKQAK